MCTGSPGDTSWVAGGWAANWTFQVSFTTVHEIVLHSAMLIHWKGLNEP